MSSNIDFGKFNLKFTPETKIETFMTRLMSAVDLGGLELQAVGGFRNPQILNQPKQTPKAIFTLGESIEFLKTTGVTNAQRHALIITPLDWQFAKSNKNYKEPLNLHQSASLPVKYQKVQLTNLSEIRAWNRLDGHSDTGIFVDYGNKEEKLVHLFKDTLKNVFDITEDDNDYKTIIKFWSKAHFISLTHLLEYFFLNVPNDVKNNIVNEFPSATYANVATSGQSSPQDFQKNWDEWFSIIK